jgi:hypothetical protein
MKLTAASTGIWAAGIEDRPAALAEKLETLAQAGANLGFVLARRAPEKPGKGVVFVAPLEGVRQCRAAVNHGFVRTNSLHALRVEGADKPGAAARLGRILGDAGINLRGFSANVVGRKFVAYLAFDDVDDMKAALKALRAAN